MTRKKLLVLIWSVCLALMLLMAACAGPTPTPTPTPTPAPTPTPTPTPVPTPTEWMPKKPIIIIAPAKSGGGSDAYSRIIAPYWTKYMPGDQPFVVVNRPGGGAVLGTTEVYTAEPDGYTIGIISLLSQGFQTLTGNVEFDIGKFEALGGPLIYRRTAVLNPKTVPEGTTWEDVVEGIYDMNIATHGFASISHVAPLLLGYESGLYDPEKLHFIHYSGTSGVVAAFLRGEPDIYFSSIDAQKKYVDEGIFSPILSFTDELHELIPETLTSVQAGIPNAKQINPALTDYKFFVAPPGTPELVLDTLAKALAKAVRDPDCIAAAEKATRLIYPTSREKIKELITTSIYEAWAKNERILELIRR